MDHATPLPRAGLIGNHRYVGKTEHAVIELVPAPKFGTWHVTTIGAGQIRTTSQPVPKAEVPDLLDVGVVRWRKRWHRPPDTNPHLPMRSKVYAVRADNGLIKIGSSINPATRLVDLQIGSPCYLELMTTFDGGSPVEHAVHRQVWEHRHHGEWFNPHPDVLAALDRCHTVHGLYAAVVSGAPWSREEGPDRWERPRRRQPDGLVAIGAIQASQPRWL